MPTSWYQAIPFILEQVQKENPNSILDIGVGFGKYGLMVREILDLPFERYNKNQWLINIEGIEAFEKYKNPIHDYVYNKIHPALIWILTNSNMRRFHIMKIILNNQEF